jgi:hypothetical protein
MPTKKELLNRGFIYVVGSLPLIFTGPAVIHFAFINKHQPLHWLILIVGIIMCVSGVLLVFKGLYKVVNSLF